MFTELKDALTRTRGTLAADAFGLLSLISLMIVALSLTSLH